MRTAILATIAWIAATAGSATAAVDPDGLAIVREAAIAAQKALKSGSGSGVARTYHGQDKLATLMRFKVAFDGEKSWLEIRYEPPRPGETPDYSRRIVICDGTGTFVSEFSPLMGSTRGRGFVHLAKTGFHHGSGRFPRDLGRHTAMMLDAQTLPDLYRFELEKAGDGGYRGSYGFGPKAPKARVTFYADPRQGYHVVSSDGQANDGTGNGQKMRAVWAQDGDVWYIKSWSQEILVEGKIGWRDEVEYEEFSANCDVSSELFTLKALELPPNSRILDHRERGKTVPRRVVDVKKDDGQERSDSIAKEVESLPVMYRTDNRQAPHSP